MFSNSNEVRQLRAGAADQIYELETAKFLGGIRVARSLILESISDLPASLNQLPVGIELLERWRGAG
ncbi:hypothetical protein AYI70_g5693 [Smittium culicis]|uniref:Uncharacterized protein n=1 Tax=Smittium culicis TaxID=133412 RepID=A0A1R1XT81_9FUNG|nr:hypothetical protein AYI70_g5721 [Smittium culicis]OMJ17867.1 hypothetical protein AYI70_g5693 [Smittium culicis]